MLEKVDCPIISSLYRSLEICVDHLKLLFSFTKQLELSRQLQGQLVDAREENKVLVIELLYLPTNYYHLRAYVRTYLPRTYLPTYLLINLSLSLSLSLCYCQTLIDSLKEAHKLLERHVESINKHTQMEAVAQLELDEVKTERQDMNVLLKTEKEKNQSLQEELHFQEKTWKEEVQITFFYMCDNIVFFPKWRLTCAIP